MEIKAARPVKFNLTVASRLKALWSRAVQNPRWFLMEACSRFVLVRAAVKAFQKRPSSSEYNLRASQFKDINVDEFVKSLSRDGYCAGLQLPTAVTDKILRFAFEAPCYGDAKPEYGFKYQDKLAAQQMTKRVFSLGTYLFMDGLQTAIDELAHDPALLAICAAYFKSRPLMTGNRLWWVFATPETDYNASVTTSFYHYDKDDYTSVRFFFYLTRVDNTHGPHVVVRGSHVRKKLSHLISLGERTDQTIVDFYGSDHLTTIYGEPGAGFAEDPYCFHKATRPVAGDRLMLEIKYATRDYKIFPEPDRALANVLDTRPARVGALTHG